MTKIIVLSLTLLVFTSCGGCSQRKIKAAKEAAMNQQSALIVADSHNSRNSLDYEGTYEGTIPCADCPGIKITLTLSADSNYTQTMLYIDRDGVFTSKGVYEWDESGSRITLTGDQHSEMYKVGEKPPHHARPRRQ